MNGMREFNAKISILGLYRAADSAMRRSAMLPLNHAARQHLRATAGGGASLTSPTADTFPD
jgi:hypothetical protein